MHCTLPQAAHPAFRVRAARPAARRSPRDTHQAHVCETAEAHPRPPRLRLGASLRAPSGGDASEAAAAAPPTTAADAAAAVTPAGLLEKPVPALLEEGVKETRQPPHNTAVAAEFSTTSGRLKI